MSIQRSVLALLAFFTISCAVAQPRQPEVLTLRDALNYAVKFNETLKKARYDIDGGRYKEDEIRSQALPQVVINGTLTDQLILPKFVLDGALVGKPGTIVTITSGTRYNATGAVSLQQQIFNQTVFTGLKAAKASEDYYRLNAQLTEEQVIEQAAANYFQVLVSRLQLALIDSNINNAIKTEGVISSQYKVGLAKRIDLDRAQVNLTNLRNQRANLGNTMFQQENQLKFSIGYPVNWAIVIPQIELEKSITATPLTDTVNYHGLPQYKLAKVQEDLQELQRKSYVSEYYPQLSLTSNYTYNGISNKFDLFNFGGGTTASWFTSAAVGLNLRIPVFNGFATRARIRQANVNILKAQEDTRTAQESLSLAYQNAKSSVTTSYTTVQSQQQNVKLAQDIYNSVQNNYKNGLASLTDLIDAENQLMQAQSSYSTALLNYKIAEVQLIQSNGNIKTLLN